MIIIINIISFLRSVSKKLIPDVALLELPPRLESCSINKIFLVLFAFKYDSIASCQFQRVLHL